MPLATWSPIVVSAALSFGFHGWPMLFPLLCGPLGFNVVCVLLAPHSRFLAVLLFFSRN